MLTRRRILVTSSGLSGVSTQASVSGFSAVHLPWLGQLRRCPYSWVRVVGRGLQENELGDLFLQRSGREEREWRKGCGYL